MMPEGKVWLVGAGPGDPELITVRGLSLLKAADVVLFDALSHPALLQHCSPEAELRDVGKLGGLQNPSQSWITEQLVELARAGRRVVRLKGGDSFLFARGAEEAQALAEAGVPFEVVPGLSSPVGTSAYAGIPLTHRDFSSSVTFITGTDKDGAGWSEESWQKLATATDTLCVLMGMRRIAEITRAVIAGGRRAATPVAVIQWGARPRQRVLQSTLAMVAQDVEDAGLKNPAVIIIGEVVSLREQLSWFERKPLFGRRVLVPRPAHQAKFTAAEIRSRGAEAVVFPVIDIHPPPDPAALRHAAKWCSDYDWVLFTSANGVDAFFESLFQQELDARALGRSQVGVIGPKTGQALERYGVRADLTAREFVGEGLCRDLLARRSSSAPPSRVLIPRALVAREELPNSLRAAGISVDVVAAYETRPVSADRATRLAAMIQAGEVDTVLFTSSSTVSSTVTALGSNAVTLLEQVTVVSIGPITTGTAEELGIQPDVTATVYTVAGALDALERFLHSGRPIAGGQALDGSL